MKKTLSFLLVCLFTTLTAHAQSVEFGAGWNTADTGTINTNYAIPTNTSATPEGLSLPNLCGGPASVVSQTGQPVISEIATPQIVSLAANLQNDPKRIFDYVHNNIKYVHYFGSKKGAFLTLLEGSGNDFDQCALFAALIRAASTNSGISYAVHFQFGFMEMPYTNASHLDLMHWLGLNWTPAVPTPLYYGYGQALWQSLNSFNYSRNFPDYENGAGNCIIDYPDGTDNNYLFQRLWVRLTIGTTNYFLDPAFKICTNTPGINLTNAMNLNMASVFSATESGATISNLYVQHLNYTNLGSQITAYNSNLLTYLTNNPNLSVEQVIGGYDIQQSNSLTLPCLNFVPYSGSFTDYYSGYSGNMPILEWDNIPTNFMTLVNVLVDNINTNFMMPSLMARKLSLTFTNISGNYESQLSLDDVVQVTSTGAVGSTTAGMTNTIIHAAGTWNYTNNNVTFTGRNSQNDVTLGTPTVYQRKAYGYVTTYGFDDVQQLLLYREQKLNSLLTQNLNPTNTAIVTETLNVIGLSWLNQTFLQASVLGAQKHEIIFYNHRAGRVAAEASYYVDVRISLSDYLWRDNLRFSSGDPSTPVVQYGQFVGSAMEHGVIEQIQTNLSASTIKTLYLANQSGQKLIVSQLYIDGTGDVGPLLNAETVRPYVASKGAVESYLQYGNVLLASGYNTVGSWNGYGLVIINGGNIGMLIEGTNGSFNGGFGGTDAPIDGSSANLFTYSTSPEAVTFKPIVMPAGYYADPINALDGSFAYDSVDMAAGQGDPRGYVFSRHYDSNRRGANASGMANGWIHNYTINAVTRSDPDAGMGRNTPQEAAAFFTAQRIGYEMFTYNPASTNKPLSECWSIAALCAEWAVDNLKSNAVNVTLGSDNVQFIKQPDGSYTPPAGITMVLSQSNSTYFLQMRHGNLLKFNANGYLANMIDQYGQSNSFTYNASNYVSNVTDWKGRSLTFNYGGTPQRLTNIADNLGRTNTFGYVTNLNGQLDLVSSTDPEGKTSAYLYDTNHEIISIFNALNQCVSSNVYDNYGHVMQQFSQGLASQIWQGFYSGFQTVLIDPAGGAQQFTYDAKYRNTATVDALGNQTQAVYDGQNHTVMTISPLNETNQYVFDANHNLLASIDPLGFSNQFIYDANFNLRTNLDARGNPSTFGYNSKFQKIAATNQAGNVVSCLFDPAYGLQLTNTDAGGSTVYAYDTYGQLSSITYPSGLGTNYLVHNVIGDVLTNISPRGITNVFQFNRRRELTNTTVYASGTNLSFSNAIVVDAVGNVSATRDALGNWTSNTWSATRRMLSTTFPATPQGAQPVITKTYDNRDWLASTTDAASNTTHYTNDFAHRLIAMTDPLLRPSTNGYDADGRCISSTDPLLETTKQQYSPRGEPLVLTDATNKSVLKQFDANANQVYLTNRLGNHWTFAYDTANELLSTISPLGFSNVMVWNNRGLLQSVTDANGQPTTYTYDALGRPTNRVDNVATDSYLFDFDGNRKAVIESGKSNTWTFDGYNRVASYTDTAGNLVQYRYDNNGNLTNLIYPGGRTVTYFYDKLNRLTNITDWANRQTTNLSYDLDNRLISLTRPNGTTLSNFYDAAGELTNIIEQAASHAPIAFFKMTFNAASRIQSVFAAPLPQSNNPPNRVLEYDLDNRLMTFNGVSISNDANGNMLYGPLTNGSGLSNYVYDARNRLLSAGGVAYGYDAIGNRIATTNAATSASYVIDPRGSQVLMRVKGATTTYYVYGPGLLYEVNETSTSTNVLTYHFDQRGSTVALTDANGNITDQIQYSAYGMTTWRTGSSDTPFLFNGRFGVQTDANGLLYMRARYYNPYICRFINADPSGFSGGLNFYAYANGDPISLTDPFGKLSQGAAPTFSYVGQDNATPNISLSFNPNVFPPQSAITAPGEKFTPQAPYYDASQPTTFTAQYGLPETPSPSLWSMLPPETQTDLRGVAIMAGIAATIAVPEAAPEMLAAEGGSQALVQMAPELYANGEGRVVAGYYLYGNSGLVGSTYNVNVFQLSAVEGQAQGLGALSDALTAEAQAAGASQISITGNAVVNAQLANPAIAARAAGMNGFTYQQVNSSQFLLTAPIKAP